jgi:hypothetical protein
MYMSGAMTLWAYLSLTAVSSFFLIYIWSKHRINKHPDGEVYLGAILLTESEIDPVTRGRVLIEPLLLICRICAIILTCLIFSALFWSPQASKGTLVISDGRVEIEEGLAPPVYVISDQEPYETLQVFDPSTQYADWHSTPPTPLFEHGLIQAPRKLGVAMPLAALNYALEFISPSEVIYQPSQPSMISQADAQWERGINGEIALKVSVLLAGHLSDGDQLMVERLNLERMHKPQRSWHKLGKLRSTGQGKVYEWLSDTQSLSLSGRPLRIVIYRNGLRRETPYPLCVPLNPQQFTVQTSFSSDRNQAAISFFESLGLPVKQMSQSKKEDNEHPQNHQKLVYSLGLSHQKKLNLDSKKLAIQKVTMFGDAWSHFNPQISNPTTNTIDDEIAKLLNIKRIWAPLSPASQMVQYPFRELSPSGRLGLTLPILPLSTLLMTKYSRVERGQPLLWLNEQSKLENRTSGLYQNWDSSTVVASHERTDEGSMIYHFGVDLEQLISQSKSWLIAILSALIHEENLTRSQCYEWTEGESLKAVLPKQLSFWSVKEDGSVKKISHRLKDNGELSVDADEQGVIMISTKTESLSSVNRQLVTDLSHPRMLYMVRRSYTSAYPEGRAKGFRHTLDRMKLEPKTALKQQLRRLSKYQKSLLGLLLIFLLVVSIVYLYLRRLTLILVITSLVLFFAVTVLSVQYWQSNETFKLTSLSDDGYKGVVPYRQTDRGDSSEALVTFPMLVSPQDDIKSDSAYATLLSHQGAKWIVPSKKAKTPLVHIAQYETFRDPMSSKVLIKIVLISSETVRADIYVGGEKSTVQIEPQGTLIGRWIEDNDQATIQFKLEVNERTGSSSLISEENVQELTLKPRKRQEYWAWGQQVGMWLASAEMSMNATPKSFLSDQLPDTLLGIALHRVSPQLLGHNDVSKLYDWVSKGGTLFILGSLNDQDRSHYKTLERLPEYRHLTPLSTSRPIPIQRSAQVVFIIDRSGSTHRDAGGPGLAEVTSQLSSLVAQLAPRDEITLISFGGGIELTLPPTFRSNLKELPTPIISRGSTVIHPALELALTYRRPSLPAHWVIVTDGDWGDEPSRLSMSLIDRIKASGSSVTIAKIKDQNIREQRLKCAQPCQSFVERLNAKVIDWRSLSVEQVHTPVNNVVASELVVEATQNWESRVGGLLPKIDVYTPMSARRDTVVLARVEGVPLLAEKQVGAGRVMQLMTDKWDLTARQWKALLRMHEVKGRDWVIALKPSVHPVKGLGVNILARSHKDILDGQASLVSSDERRVYLWHPLRIGESVLSDCSTINGSSPDEKCEPVWLSQQEAEVFLLKTNGYSDPSPEYIVPSTVQSRNANVEQIQAMYTHLALSQLRDKDPIINVSEQPLVIPTEFQLDSKIDELKRNLNQLNSWTYAILTLVVILLMVFIETKLWSREARST